MHDDDVIFADGTTRGEFRKRSALRKQLIADEALFTTYIKDETDLDAINWDQFMLVFDVPGHTTPVVVERELIGDENPHGDVRSFLVTAVDEFQAFEASAHDLRIVHRIDL